MSQVKKLYENKCKKQKFNATNDIERNVEEAKQTDNTTQNPMEKSQTNIQMVESQSANNVMFFFFFSHHFSNFSTIGSMQISATCSSTP